MQDLFRNAGTVAYPLLFCSVLAFGIILERLFALGRLGRQEDRAFVAWEAALRDTGVSNDARGSNGSAALPPPLRDAALRSAPVSRVVEDALLPLAGHGESALAQAADIALGQERLRLRRYLGTLATIGSTAPFIGLFGTVLGIMSAFQQMSQVGLSGERISGGIAEALSATALGLLVAVPSVIAYNYFTGRVQALLLKVQGHVARLSPLLQAGSGNSATARTPVSIVVETQRPKAAAG